MKRLYQASKVIILVLVAVSAAVGQEKLTKSPVAEKKGAEAEMSALELRGIELIREAGRDASTLVDRRQAVRIQASAADSLWKHDENTARAFFSQAFENASTYYRDSRDENVDKIGEASVVPRSDLRLEVIRLASRHDGALAKTFTDQFVAEKRREAESKTAQSNWDRKRAGDPALFGTSAPATADLMSAASSLLSTDHKMAADLAMRAIAGGVTQPVPNFLAQLSIRDRASADRVFQAALERVAAEPQVVPGQLLLLAAYPFGENRVWISDGNGTSSIGFGRLPKFEVNERQIAGFLRISAAVLNRASEINTAQNPDLAPRFNSALFAARVLGQKVAKHDPALLENWRALVSKLQSAAQQKTRDGIDNTLREMTAENQSPEERSANASDRVKSMIDAAERTSDLVERDNRFGSAATTAMQGGDFARALEIADRIGDTDYKQRIREWINSRAANKAIEEKRIDDALRYANEVSATDERAYLYYQIAKIALGSQDKARALQLAEDAANYVSRADNGLGKLRALIGLAGLYSKVDVARSFELLTEAAKVADRIGDYSPEQARLVRTLSNRSGSNNMVSMTTVEEFDLGKTFATFAAIDFDRTLGLANAFESKALKHSTVIAVASTLFDRKPAKTGS
jgi:tetratricopeptide (TPR) repeat protein